MADPQVYNTPVAIEAGEAIATLQGLLADIPDASVTYAERHGNPILLHSPVTLLEAAKIDHGVREVHRTDILVGTLARIVADQQRRIAALEAELEDGAKPTKRRES
jgi:hypothetical protein